MDEALGLFRSHLSFLLLGRKLWEYNFCVNEFLTHNMTSSLGGYGFSVIP
jgi:hypothetical protein